MARIVSTAAVNAIRNEYNVYNPVTLAYEDSILLEGARTNAWIYSIPDPAVAWTYNAAGPSVAINNTTAPDGTVTASKFIEAPAASGVLSHLIFQTLPALADNTIQSASVYAKYAGRLFLLRTRDKANVTVFSYINLQTGTVSSLGAGHTINITVLANGWYRITLSYNSSAGGAIPVVQFGTAETSGVSSYLGDGVSGVYLWGAQYETDQPFSSSYIPTGAATVTRAADNYSIPFNLPPQEMTVYCKFIEKGTINTSASRIYSQGNLASDTSSTLIHVVSGKYTGWHHNGTSSVQVGQAVAPVIGDQVELRYILGSNGSVTLGQSINGAAETVFGPTAALTLLSAWPISNMFINNRNGTFNGFNAFQSIKVARGTLTLAQMRAL